MIEMALNQLTTQDYVFENISNYVSLLQDNMFERFLSICNKQESLNVELVLKFIQQCEIFYGKDQLKPFLSVFATYVLFEFSHKVSDTILDVFQIYCSKPLQNLVEQYGFDIWHSPSQCLMSKGQAGNPHSSNARCLQTFNFTHHTLLAETPHFVNTLLYDNSFEISNPSTFIVKRKCSYDLSSIRPYSVSPYLYSKETNLPLNSTIECLCSLHVTLQRLETLKRTQCDSAREHWDQYLGCLDRLDIQVCPNASYLNKKIITQIQELREYFWNREGICLSHFERIRYVYAFIINLVLKQTCNSNGIPSKPCQKLNDLLNPMLTTALETYIEPYLAPCQTDAILAACRIQLFLMYHSLPDPMCSSPIIRSFCQVYPNLHR